MTLLLSLCGIRVSPLVCLDYPTHFDLSRFNDALWSGPLPIQ